MSVEEHQTSFLSTRIGALTLVLLCAVQFLDVVDGSIVNVALPSIQHDLHFSQQNLQWVASGYVLTYGGFLLLGGRAADLLGRRRMLVAGVLLFACCSLAGGLARNESTLIAARLAQGLGRRADGTGGTLARHHLVQGGRRPAQGTRDLGRDQRPRCRRRRLLRRSAVGGAGVALGAVRQPPVLRADPRRRVPAAQRGSAGWGRVEASTCAAPSSSPAGCSCSSTR